MARILINDRNKQKQIPKTKKVMRTKLIAALFVTMSTVGFSQKKALGAAKKALKSGNLEAAADALKAAEGQLGAADAKTKSLYYLLNGQVIGKKTGGSLEKIEAAATAYNKVMEVENEAGAKKYSEQAFTELQLLRQSLIEGAIKDQNAGNNKLAAEKLYLGYKTNTKDTLYLYYAASNAVNAKDYDKALNYYNELVTIGFNGIEETFVATNKTSGEVESFQSRQLRNASVKAGSHIKPETKKSASKRSEITKNIVLIYVSQGKDEEAKKAIATAKEANPGDPALLQAEADMFYKTGDIEKYKEIMEQIVANDPENPDLLYNLGVSASKLGDNEQAIAYYEKALELKPDYGSAQINIASIILSGEQKIVEEMNGLGTSSSDYKKYDALKLKREELYKKAVPYLEGALESAPDNVEAVRTLMNIFYQLDDPKADEMKNKLKALEGGS